MAGKTVILGADHDGGSSAQINGGIFLIRIGHGRNRADTPFFQPLEGFFCRSLRNGHEKERSNACADRVRVVEVGFVSADDDGVRIGG